MHRQAFGLLIYTAAAFVAGCTPPFDPSSSGSAQTSYAVCDRGGKACVLKPMTMLVLDNFDPSRDFQYGSWILFDPRPSPGQHYIALMDDANRPFCEGFYTSFVLNTTAPLAMSCSSATSRGRGQIHFGALQTDGAFSGETTGTGSVKTASGTIYFVHGVTVEEAQSASFGRLWQKYGGGPESAMAAREPQAVRAANLPDYLITRPANSAAAIEPK